jgi:hypothetical protein
VKAPGYLNEQHTRTELRLRDKIEQAWPKPLAEEAYYGPAGEFVKLIEPHSEADSVALLTQFLTGFGNIIGAHAFFQVEADRHFLKLFSVLVGESSKSRKGTSWGYIKKVFCMADPSWAVRIMQGLSSGEGLIWQVRDEIKKSEPIKDKGKVTGEYQEIIIDPGENDKRLLVVEPEFASILRVMGRDGNTLSPIIRQAWDGEDLRTLTKNNPARATGAHISIIGHITKDELKRYLDRTEIGNGFGNRFLWLCVKRSKTLPEGGRIKESDFWPIIQRLKEIVEFGKQVGEIKKDNEAAEIWASVYPELSEGKPGLWGAVTSRGEAQVMRIACKYAILDKSVIIRKEHLLPALALWDYAEESARYIFGDAIGDPVADQIMQALRNAQYGLTRSQISGLFAHNMDKGRIDAALAILLRYKLARMVTEKTGGRSIERWLMA